MPAGATSLIAKLQNPTAPDFDIYVGTGEVSAANVVCQSASAGSNESCEIADPEPGTTGCWCRTGRHRPRRHSTPPTW